MVTQSKFYLPVVLHNDAETAQIIAPFVSALPLVQSVTDEIVVLSLSVGYQLQGLYAFDGVSWRYAMPMIDISEVIIEGDTVDVYSNETLDVSLPIGSIIYKNGQPQTSDEITHGNAIYAVRTPPAGGSGSGSVVSVSLASANGFSGSVANPTTTPVITLNTTAVGVLKGVAGAMAAAIAGTDYSLGTAALATGILKNTTGTGAHSIAIAADFPTLNQNTTGNAATVTTNANLTGDVTSVGNATTLANSGVNAGIYGQVTVDAKGRVTSGIIITPVPSGGTGAATLTGLLKGNGISPVSTASTSDVTTALGFTPYNATNPAGYITASGAPVQTVAGRTGAVTLGQADIAGLTATSSPTFAAVSAASFTGSLIGTANAATNVAGGVAGAVHYQSAVGVTGFSAAGTLGQVLLSGGTGTPTWGNAGTGTVTGVTGTAPVISSGGTAPVISMAAATSSVPGFLTSADWNTFNGKLSANQVITISGDATGSGATAIALTLAASGVTAGTYGQVTVDAKGRVTTGTVISPVANGGTGVATISGLIKGNGTAAFTVALAGTDYAAPTSGSSILSGNGTGGFSNVTVGSGLSFSAGTLSATGAGTGTVTTVSVVSANGLSGSVATATTTPAITLSTTVTGMLKGSAGALVAGTSGTDYSAGTSALATGILKSTTATGALTIAVAADFPTLNQSTTGNAATATLASTVTTNANLTGDVTSVGNATTLGVSGVSAGTYGQVTVDVKGRVTVGFALNDVAHGGTGVATITGLVKGSGTSAFTAAVAGTDYAAPTSGSAILAGNAAGGFANVTVGSGLSFSAGTLSATGGGSGTVTTTSVVSANGFSGSVANPTTTPAITLSTSISGLLKGSAGALAAAIAGTDFAAPTSGAAILSGNAAGGFANVTIGSGLSFSAGILSATGGGSGTVTSASVVPANGFSGSVATATTTPAITLSTTASGILKGAAGSLVAATSGTDYSAGTSALTTGIVKTTTGTGALTVAIAADFPTLNQNTTGNAATVTTNANLTGDVTSVGNTTTLSNSGASAGTYGQVTIDAKGRVTVGTTITDVAHGGTGVATITGLVKGTGTTAMTAAVAGTDYAAPTTGAALLYGNGAGGFSNATVGSGLTFSGGVLASVSGGGSVTTVSVVAANGFSGSVTNPGSTPAITLTTSVSGLLKGSASALVAAVAGTDYAAPTSGSSVLSGDGAGGFSNVTIGSGLSFSAGTLSATGGGGGSSTIFSQTSRYTALGTANQTCLVTSSSDVKTGITWSLASNVLTLTDVAHGHSIGDMVIVRNANVAYQYSLITATPTADTFSIAAAAGTSSGSAAGYSMGFTYAHNAATGSINGGTLTPPANANVALLSLRLHLGANTRTGTTYAMTLLGSAANGAGDDTSMDNTYVPYVGFRQDNSTLTAFGGTLAVNQAAAGFNVYQVGALPASTVGIALQFQF